MKYTMSWAAVLCNKSIYMQVQNMLTFLIRWPRRYIWQHAHKPIKWNYFEHLPYRLQPTQYKSAAMSSKKEKKSASPATATNGGRNKKRGKYTTFKQRLADLKAYKEKHGHINVKADEDKALYQFCASAKHSFRKSLP